MRALSKSMGQPSHALTVGCRHSGASDRAVWAIACEFKAFLTPARPPCPVRGATISGRCAVLRSLALAGLALPSAMVWPCHARRGAQVGGTGFAVGWIDATGERRPNRMGSRDLPASAGSGSAAQSKPNRVAPPALAATCGSTSGEKGAACGWPGEAIGYARRRAIAQGSLA